MELRPHFRLMLIVSCHMVIFTGTAALYDAYYVEQDCRTGILNISLTDSGQKSAVFLRATEDTSYSIAMDCQIKITAPASHRIMVAVLEIGFRVFYPTSSCKDYVQIHIQRIMCKNLYRIDEERHFESSDNTMQILYHVSQDGLNNQTLSGLPGMKLTVTALKEKGKCPRSDDQDWFHCDNGYCVWSGLKCDTHNNCGDLSDEQDCDGGSNQSTALIILGCLILLLMVIMCVATLLCSKNENIRRFSNRLRSRTLSYMPRFSK